MNKNEQQFIQTVQEALDRQASVQEADIIQPVPDNVEQRLSSYLNKSREEMDGLLALFMEKAGLINTSVYQVDSPRQAAAEILDLTLKAQPEWGGTKSVVAWDHPLVNELGLKTLFASQGIDFFSTRENTLPDENVRTRVRENIIHSFIGITSADFALAQTATLVMRTIAGQPRAVSIVPSIHVAVISIEHILSSLEELYFRLNWDPAEQEKGLTNCMSFVTGPSKTADIELTLVHGAHGPKQLVIYVINNQ